MDPDAVDVFPIEHGNFPAMLPEGNPSQVCGFVVACPGMCFFVHENGENIVLET